MKRWLIPVFLSSVMIAAPGCDILFDDPTHIYEGPPQVEFAPVLPAGNYARTITIAATNTATQTTNVRVNYIGPPPGSSVTGGITLADTNTAVEGTHFRFPGGREYTIAAGANFVDVPVELLGAGLERGATVSLVLELGPGSVQVAENYKRFTITFRKSQ